jgi:hypothetical protein
LRARNVVNQGETPVKRMPWRLGVAIVLVLSLVGATAPNEVVAQQEGTATLTIHSRFCPVNYEMSDMYNTCRGTVGDRGVEFYLSEISARSSIPAEDGNITFTGLFAGLHRLQNTFPSELHQVYVYCSSDITPGYLVDVADGSYGNYLADIVLSDGENMICDWYTIPNADFDSQRASITLHLRICLLAFFRIRAGMATMLLGWHGRRDQILG